MIELDKPVAVAADVEIRFSGHGEARFRLQHAVDRNGAPDELSWCDVSQVSSRDFKPSKPIEAGQIFMPMVDRVDGELSLIYKRYSAGWLRVLPLDENDDEAVKRCQTYSISIAAA